MATAGMVLWVAWIILLFFIAVPKTDRLLGRAAVWLKPLSITIMTLLLMVGIVEYELAAAVGAGITVPNFIGPTTTELLQNQHINLTYNDATALCH
jgi:hypothetical protein